MISISQIRTDGGTQSRAAINEATVSEYAEAMADPATVFPPIVVYFDGRDYWLADGFHRVAAWQRVGRQEVPAEIRQGDRRSAILHSVAANSAHGLRRTNEDKRRAVLTLLEDAEWSQWSDREIARRCAVSHEFVRRIRGGSLSTVDSEPQEQARTYTTKHGTEAVMSTTRIGAAPKQAPDRDREPAQPAAGKPQAAPQIEPPASEPIDAAEVQQRRELAKLSAAGLIDEVIGLRASLREQHVKRREAEAEVSRLKEELAFVAADGDMGAKVTKLLGDLNRAGARLKEEQVKSARETRRANLFEKECNKLRAQLGQQIIPMDGAA